MATSDELYAERLRQINESKRLAQEFIARIDQANTTRNKISEQAKITLDQINGNTSLTDAQRAQQELDLRNNTIKPANDSIVNAYESILTDMNNAALTLDDLNTLLQITGRNIDILTQKVDNNDKRTKELQAQLGARVTMDPFNKQREKDSASGKTAGDSQPANTGSDGTGTTNNSTDRLTEEERRNLSNTDENQSQAETRRLLRKRDDAAEPGKEKSVVDAKQSVNQGDARSTDPATVTDNILHNYASYTYGLTLHLLPPESFNKLARGEPWLADAQTLISSAGRWGQNPNDPQRFVRPAVFSDDFYFDGFNMNTVIGMSAQGKASNVIDINFNLIEPYGLTLLNRLLDIADELNIPNYLHNPYVIQIDFFGNSDTGLPVHPIPNITKYVPVKLTTMKIKVGTGGATYACTAIPYNHQAFAQNMATTPVTFEVKAKTVRDFFQNTADETNLAVRAKQDQQRQKDIANLQKSINKNKGRATFTPKSRAGGVAKQEIAVQDNTSQAMIDAKKKAMAKPYEVNSYNGAFNSYQEFLVSSETAMYPSKIIFEIDDEIADSLIVYEKKNSLQTSTMNNNTDKKSINKSVAANYPGGVGKRGGNNTAGPDLSMERFNINQGTSIMDVINMVMRSSKYITDQLKDEKQLDKDGNPVNWFKVVPQMQLKQFDTKLNQFSYEITYKIKKYTYHNSKHPAVSTSSQEQVERNLRKSYKYIYTGKNTDIIDFSIDFDALFFTAVNVGTKKQEALSDSQDAEYTGAGGSGQGSSEFAATDPRRLDRLPAQKTNDVQPTQTAPISVDLSAGGMNSGQNASIQRAADVAKSIYSGARGDMINLKLKIIGDPDFIKQDDIYFLPGNPNYPVDDVRTDNGSILTDRGDIFAKIAFRTPVDIDTYTGGLRTDEKYIDSNFSGIYKIIKVASELRAGRFEQTLDMIRFPDANVDPATANSKKERNDGEASTTPGQDELNAEPPTKATNAASLRAIQNQQSGSEAAPEQSYNEVESAKAENTDNTSTSKLEQVTVSGETRNVTEVQATNSTAKDSTADRTATAPAQPVPQQSKEQLQRKLYGLQIQGQELNQRVKANERLRSQVQAAFSYPNRTPEDIALYTQELEKYDAIAAQLEAETDAYFAKLRDLNNQIAAAD